MTVDGSTTPAEPPRRDEQRKGDVVSMSEAEKLAAEWEARHDVAARGRRSAPDVLQHYMAHERLVERSGSTAHPHGPRRDEGGGTGDPVGAAEPTAEAPAAPPSRRRLFGWLRRGRS